jgi:hypothetical protein
LLGAVDDLSEDVPVVEIHLVVDGVVDGVVVVALELYVASVLELVDLADLHRLPLHHLLLEDMLQVLPLLALRLVLLQHLHLQQVAVLLEVVPFPLTLALLPLPGVAQVLQVSVGSIVPELIRIIVELG